MGKWLELFRTLTKDSGIEPQIPLTPDDSLDTSKETAGLRVRHLRDSFLTGANANSTRPGVSTAVNEVSQSKTAGFLRGVIGVTGVNASPLKNAQNGYNYLASPSAIEVSDAAAYDAALTVFCDFETRNAGGCDLKTAGAWRYAADPATEILCFGYRIGGVDHSWAPTTGSRDPLERLAADPAAVFVRFGAFEAAVWSQIMVERHGFPPIETRRWVDLRATASSLALPRSLDKALAALGLPIRKDKEGQRLVRSLSRPDRKTGAYPELTPAIVERVAEYNRIDILALEAMRGQGLGVLSAAEQAVWELDQRINARGIAIDVGFVEAAKRIADQAMGEAIAEFARLTGGISPLQVQKTKDWLKGRACVLPNLDSEAIGDALELAGLPDDVRRVLEIRQITAATSLKKLDAMLACVGVDGRGPWSSAVSRRDHRAMVRAIDSPAELSAADARDGSRSRGTDRSGQDRRPRAAPLLGQADRRVGFRIASCADCGRRHPILRRRFLHDRMLCAAGARRATRQMRADRERGRRLPRHGGDHLWARPRRLHGDPRG
jgi:hypothetical protein